MAKTLNMADLRSKSDEELATFITSTTKDLVEVRFQNYTNQLADTSRIGKLRRDLARALSEKTQRAAKAAVKA
ncbi:MAG: 50S ribosomal protein L29 [Polyangiales bacterium]